jgi:hypothetical protein
MLVVRDPLDEFIDASPGLQRPALRVLRALGRRPRGLALLSKIAPADQVATGLQSMARYDDPKWARPLGWDAEAVVARGRELRRREGRP